MGLNPSLVGLCKPQVHCERIKWNCRTSSGTGDLVSADKRHTCDDQK